MKLAFRTNSSKKLLIHYRTPETRREYHRIQKNSTNIFTINLREPGNHTGKPISTKGEPPVR